VDEDFYDHGLKMSVMHKDVACLPALLSSAVWSLCNLAVLPPKILAYSVVLLVAIYAFSLTSFSVINSHLACVYKLFN
jgi:hypothetical protein